MTPSTFQKNYSILNNEQKQAVDTLYGPIMVVAGPGTGKTQIIALRTANIILKAQIHPENILITTFTEAWVIAIRERLMDFIGEEAYKVQVCTIHSFAQDIIKTFPEKFIEHKAGIAIDDVDQMEILRNILEEQIELGNIEHLSSDYDPLYYLRDIKSRISTLKQEWVTPDNLLWLIEKQETHYEEVLSEIKPTLKKYETTKEKHAKHIEKLKELRHLYVCYNTHLRQTSRYDFNDMINFVLEKFRVDQSLRVHYAEIYQFIMLDEYQDTNNPQNEIINSILKESIEEPNIMVVGDDDQSIYRFQGANIENMLDFYTIYPKTQFIVLKSNYRSNQHILDTAKTLIENNNGRLINKIDSLEKHLVSEWKHKNSSIVPSLYRAQSEVQEDAYILNNIQQILNKGGDISEIAVIVRNNREVKKWTTLLSQNNIASESKMQSNILDSQYVQFILDLLELIQNPYSNEKKLIDIARSNVFKNDQVDILRINRHLYIENYRKKVPTRFIDVLTNASVLKSLSLSNQEALETFTDSLFLLQSKLNETNLRDFFSFAIDHIGILEHIAEKWSFDDVQDVYTLLNAIKTWSHGQQNFSVNDLLLKISLYSEYNYPIHRQILKKAKTWVQILTAHGSKWLEYETVFIPGLYTGNWDWKKIPDKLKLPLGIAGEGIQELQENLLEEERRLFFVALTRAKNTLFLSFPAGIWTKPLLPSLFLEEIQESISESPAIEIDIEHHIVSEIKNTLISYSSLEFDYISEFLKNYRLSPSDLNTFLNDPLEFLSRVVFKYPFNGNKFTIFGTVYHRTLELFYLKYKNEGKLPDVKYLTTTFSHLIKQEFLTPSELEEALEKWIQGLEWYYSLYAHNMKEPFLLEYSFRRKNIFFEWIPLTWAIDKVEKLWETQDFHTTQQGDSEQMAFFKDTVTLIDYKTGKSKTENVVKGLDRYGNKKPGEWGYFRQLMFYQLLCENDREFTEKFSIWAVAIDFVEGKDSKYNFLELTPSLEEYQNFKQELSQARKEISDIDFWKELLQKK